jgi:twitching motility protein PilT
VLSVEVLVNTPLIRDYIKDADKTSLIKEALMEDNLRGMQTFDQNLVELYLDGRITLEDATFMATSPHELRLMITQRVGARDAPDELEFERLMRKRGPLG